MIASTCLAVLFVPSFFVVLQRFAEWRSGPQRVASVRLIEPLPSPRRDRAQLSRFRNQLGQPAPDLVALGRVLDLVDEVRVVVDLDHEDAALVLLMSTP